MNDLRSRGAALQPAQPDGVEGAAHERRWTILFTLCLSLLAVMLANSSINLALPALSRELGLTQLELTWVVEAYALVFASLLFLAGAVADRYGRQRVMQMGLAVFLAASLYAAFIAGTGTQLIAARLVMGIGGAMVMPTTLSIVNVVFPRGERARAIAVWSGIAGAGIMVGSIASGVLLEFFSWEATFLFAGVIAIAALVGNQLVVPESRDETGAPVDWTGGILAAVGLGGLVYAIMEAPSRGLTDPLILATVVGGTSAIAAFVWYELHTDHPLLDVRMFRAPALGISTLSITLTFFALTGAFFGMSQLFQLVMGFSALTSSFAMLPVMIPMIVISPLVPRVVALVGTKWTVSAGMAVMSIGFVLAANWPTVPSYWQVLGTLAIMVLGMAFVMTTATNTMMASVPRRRSGMGSALNDTTRELGGALGVALLGSMISSGYTDRIASALVGLPDQLRVVAGGSLGGAMAVAEQAGAAGAPLAAAAKEAYMAGNSSAMFISAGIAACAALIVALWLPNRLSTDVAAEPASRADDPGVVSPREVTT